MLDMNVVQPLLQRSLNLMETASCWERKAAKKAHIVGLQGEKRRLRYLSREARNIVDWIEHTTYDLFRIDICAKEGNIDVNELVNSKSTMNGVIEKLWVIYNETHQIANELVIAKARTFASQLYFYTNMLFDILSELQRLQIEYEKVNYDYIYISRRQTTSENIHDKYECEEEKQGYKDIND